jgi:hypothetical protein
MFSREQFAESILNEGRILKHLFTKVPAGKLDYRPTPEQRSIAELLEYLPLNAGPLIEAIVLGDFKGLMEGADKFKAEARKDFAGTIERETRRVAELLKNVPDADFQSREVQMPSGIKMKMGAALVNFPLKFLTAYRMQLFLYLKFCGRSELKTSNLWKGEDPAPGGQKAHG